MYGLTRGLMTLIGVAVAGGLIWLASWVGPRDSSGEYWAAMGLVAGAGLVMALSQLLGGWTKWGLPTISGNVLGFGFLPALVAGAWILVAAQPNANEAQDRILGWSSDIGISGFVADMTPLVGAIAFGLGLVFGLVFDTTGPRRREIADRERYAADEPVAAERGRHEETQEVEQPAREPVGVGSRDERTTPSAPEPEAQPRRRSFFRR